MRWRVVLGRVGRVVLGLTMLGSGCGPAQVGLEGGVGFAAHHDFIHRPNGGFREEGLEVGPPLTAAATVMWPVHPRLRLGLDGGASWIKEAGLPDTPRRTVMASHFRADLYVPTGGAIDLHGRASVGGVLTALYPNEWFVGASRRLGIGVSHETEGVRVGAHVEHQHAGVWPLATLWRDVVLFERQLLAFRAVLVGFSVEAPW